jgi:hypothetical protein
MLLGKKERTFEEALNRRGIIIDPTFSKLHFKYKIMRRACVRARARAPFTRCLCKGNHGIGNARFRIQFRSHVVRGYFQFSRCDKSNINLIESARAQGAQGAHVSEIENQAAFKAKSSTHYSTRSVNKIAGRTPLPLLTRNRPASPALADKRPS